MKKNLAFPVILLSLIILSGCKTNQGAAESKVEDMAKVNYPLQILFEVEDSSAGGNLAQLNVGPQNNINGQGFYIEIQGAKVSAVLPCFCLPTITNGYKPPLINFDDKSLQDLTYQRYQDTREFTLRFEVLDRSDRWLFELHVNPNRTAYMNVRSGRMPVVGYTGKVSSPIQISGVPKGIHKSKAF